MSVAESVVERIEGAGGKLGLNGERIRVRLPEDAVHLLEELRAHKDEVLTLLRRREEIPAMPPDVRLISWKSPFWAWRLHRRSCASRNATAAPNGSFVR
jgi:hypothetical protein